MWTVEIVKARFIEAADIERRMFVKGMSGGGNGWPAYLYTAEDRAGWDDMARQDALEKWQGRNPTKTPEITRWQECFEWALEHVDDPIRRRILWGWAHCIASGRSFSKLCEQKGWVRVTCYRRLDRIFAALAATLRNEGCILREPDARWCIQDARPGVRIESTLPNSVSEPIRPKHPPFRTEKPHDTLTTPAAIAAFAQHLADTNEARRKARLRKALRGVPGEAGAAA